MRKTVIILEIIFVLFCFCAYTPLFTKTSEENESDLSNIIVGEYPPTIYVNNKYYQINPRGEYWTELPQKYKKIGEITNTVRQDEPIPAENFTSNSEVEGTEIYYDEEESDTIIAKIFCFGDYRYIPFEKSLIQPKSE